MVNYLSKRFGAWKIKKLQTVWLALRLWGWGTQQPAEETGFSELLGEAPWHTLTRNSPPCNGQTLPWAGELTGTAWLENNLRVQIWKGVRLICTITNQIILFDTSESLHDLRVVRVCTIFFLIPLFYFIFITTLENMMCARLLNFQLLQYFTIITIILH